MLRYGEESLENPIFIPEYGQHLGVLDIHMCVYNIHVYMYAHRPRYERARAYWTDAHARKEGKQVLPKVRGCVTLEPLRLRDYSENIFVHQG